MDYDKKSVVKYKGQEVKLGEFCKQNDIPIDVVLLRVSQGMTIEEAIDHELDWNESGSSLSHLYMKPVYSYKGETGSMSAICRKNHVTRNSVLKQMEKGMTFEEAIDFLIESKAVYTFEGSTGTITELCEIFGFNVVRVFRSKTRTTQSIEDIFRAEMAIKNVEMARYSVNGFEGSFKEICEHYGLSEGEVIGRYLRNGRDMKKALENESSWKIILDTPIKVNGKTVSLPDLCSEYGVSLSDVRHKVIHTKTSNPLLAVQELKRYDDLTSKITYRKFTGSLKEVCDHFGLNFVAVRRPIGCGLSPKESLDNEYEWVQIKKKKCTIEGFSGTYEEVMEHFELNPSDIRRRILRLGQEPITAVQTLIEKKKN